MRLLHWSCGRRFRCSGLVIPNTQPGVGEPRAFRPEDGIGQQLCLVVMLSPEQTLNWVGRASARQKDVTMFDIDQFIADCRAALAADKSYKSVREIVARAVSDPAAILKGLGEPKRSEMIRRHYKRVDTMLRRP